MNRKNIIVGFSDYMERNRPKVMNQIKTILKSKSLQYIIVNGCHDLWLRDFMPFQRQDGKFVRFRYSPDYLNNKPQYITNLDSLSFTLYNKDTISKYNSIEHLIGDYITTDLIIDGGNIIKCVDNSGNNCVIMTQKVLFENPIMSHISSLKELENVFNAEIILIPWDKTEKFGHADGMVRALNDGGLLLNCYSEMDKELHFQLMSALSNRFNIYELKYGSALHPDSWCHINYLELENDILIPSLHITSDCIAKEETHNFTGKDCHLIYMPEIILSQTNGGGAMNCTSWEYISTI